jgi:hypothetical protein
VNSKGFRLKPLLNHIFRGANVSTSTEAIPLRVDEGTMPYFAEEPAISEIEKPIKRRRSK